jgi:hypothetical protein
MSRQLSLSTSASCILDGDGNGTAAAGPGLPGVSWQPSNIAVSASTNISEAQCYLYLGILPIPASLQAATATGSTGDSTGFSATVWPGQQLIAVWSGGDPGATATMAITGTQTVPQAGS